MRLIGSHAWDADDPAHDGEGQVDHDDSGCFAACRTGPGRGVRPDGAGFGFLDEADADVEDGGESQAFLTGRRPAKGRRCRQGESKRR
jgi:hypothetical protein